LLDVFFSLRAELLQKHFTGYHHSTTKRQIKENNKNQLEQKQHQTKEMLHEFVSQNRIKT